MEPPNQNKSELFSDRPRILPRIALHSHVRKWADASWSAATAIETDWERTMNCDTSCCSHAPYLCALAGPWPGRTRRQPADADQRCGGEPCAAVFRGLFAFFDRDLHGLDGNGRSCADCHMVTEQFQLTPAAAEAGSSCCKKRRRHNPNADDPLFRPIDADDFRINGEQASDLQQSAPERPDPHRLRAAAEHPS